LFNLVALKPQMEWRGDRLMPTGFKVCGRCLDVPFQLDRPIVLPPDPVPVRDPRPEHYRVEVTNFRITTNGDRRVTEAGDPRIVQDTGDAMLEFLRAT